MLGIQDMKSGVYLNLMHLLLPHGALSSESSNNEGWPKTESFPSERKVMRELYSYDYEYDSYEQKNQNQA